MRSIRTKLPLPGQWSTTTSLTAPAALYSSEPTMPGSLIATRLSISQEVSVGAIYLVRSPMDLVVARARHFSVSIDQAIGEICTLDRATEATPHDVNAIEGSWSQNVASWVLPPSPAVLVVRFEDLVLRPDAAYRSIAGHLRKVPNPEQLRPRR